MSDWKQWNYNSYISEFLALRCAGDVLNIVNPLGTKAGKEISEAMAIIHALRSVVLREPMVYSVYDLCAGNALASVTAVHLLPVKHAVAYDKNRRKRAWDKVDRFDYIEFNVMDSPIPYMYNPGIIVSIHPCKSLAPRVIELYKAAPHIKHLILIPCCRTNVPDVAVPHYVQQKLDGYELFSLKLSLLAGGNMTRDTKCLSPCNAVITAHKE
jgi:hypothetical protein